jgi:ElaB/YqjD/DUF883 family membrane-anchored ribosome-binding protein
MKDEAIRTNYDAVVKDISDLKKDTTSLANNVQGKAGETVSIALNRIEDTLAEIWKSVSKRGVNSYETVERNVEQRPMAAVIVALVAGAALGWMLDRR